MTNDVVIYAETIEIEAKEQIRKLAQHPVSDCSKIRIMPDAHAGAGCTIGTTMTITDRVCPNLVGVDIGCGMFAVNLGKIEIDYAKLDRFIRASIPSGMMIRTEPVEYFDFSGIRCPNADTKRAQLSIGTLGGGNHFIEIDKDGRIFLNSHFGARRDAEPILDVTDDDSFDWKGFAEKHIKMQIFGDKAKIDIWCQIEHRFDEFISYCWDGIHKRKTTRKKGQE